MVFDASEREARARERESARERKRKREREREERRGEERGEKRVTRRRGNKSLTRPPLRRALDSAKDLGLLSSSLKFVFVNVS